MDNPSSPTIKDPFTFLPWYPKGVTRFVGTGTSNYVALTDDSTVLKFPIVPPDEPSIYPVKLQAYRSSLRECAVHGLEVERQILTTLGSCPRTVRLVGVHEHGLLLEYMPNGSVESYLCHAAQTPLEERIKWVAQATEGIAYAHAKNVLHCDISVHNLLLDSALNVKLSDFQGKLLDSGGAVVLDGGSSESVISSMPRPDRDRHDRKTDIFALGTAIYFIMTGELPFPDLDLFDNEEEIQRRFQVGDFPPLEQQRGGDVIFKCWKGLYEDAAEIILDLQKLAL